MSKIVVPIKIQTDRKTTDDLGATLQACNTAANYISTVAWESREFSKFGIQRLAYAKVKEEFGLGAQATVRTIAKVADAYNSGDQKFRRTRKRQFSWSSAQPFDSRNMSWSLEDKTLSIWTINGRAKSVPFLCASWQLELLRHNPIAESDLVFRKGSFYVYATIDIADEAMNESPDVFLGVDLGIVNIATLSDGTNFSGKHLNHVRNRNLRLRRKLQKKGTRSAKRLLVERSGCEARFAKDTNHCISKKIVTEAKRTGHGIALEDLEGIRSRVRLRKPQRVALNSWGILPTGIICSIQSDSRWCSSGLC
ncbi:transposase [Ferrimicrobium sp.]|uniref:transposase n=1 Tax=Ferrimicrobium sp. TaxID=2926050 RepID=UPI0026258F64|nr:transposase [Ferrimicrobium sp.]